MDAHELSQFSRPNDFIFKITQSEEVCKNQIERKQKTKASKSKTKTESPNGQKNLCDINHYHK